MSASRQASARNKVVVQSTDESFRALVLEHGPYVSRTLRYLGVAETDLEDHLQEVFLVVHRRIADFEGRSSLRTWLYGICLRKAQRYRRSRARRREKLVERMPESGASGRQEQSIELAEARAVLRSLLENLDEDKRSVFVLFEIERLPMNEVAEIVGCPLHTGYSRLRAARKQVEQAFHRHKAAQGEA